MLSGLLTLCRRRLCACLGVCRCCHCRWTGRRIDISSTRVWTLVVRPPSAQLLARLNFASSRDWTFFRSCFLCWPPSAQLSSARTLPPSAQLLALFDLNFRESRIGLFFRNCFLYWPQALNFLALTLDFSSGVVLD